MSNDPVSRSRKPSAAKRRPNQPAERSARTTKPEGTTPEDRLKRHQEELLDEAIEETFPASDPISPKKIT